MSIPLRNDLINGHQWRGRRLFSSDLPILLYEPTVEPLVGGVVPWDILKRVIFIRSSTHLLYSPNRCLSHLPINLHHLHVPILIMVRLLLLGWGLVTTHIVTTNVCLLICHIVEKLLLLLGCYLSDLIRTESNNDTSRRVTFNTFIKEAIGLIKLAPTALLSWRLVWTSHVWQLWGWLVALVNSYGPVQLALGIPLIRVFYYCSYPSFMGFSKWFFHLISSFCSSLSRNPSFRVNGSISTFILIEPKPSITKMGVPHLLLHHHFWHLHTWTINDIHLSTTRPPLIIPGLRSHMQGSTQVIVIPGVRSRWRYPIGVLSTKDGDGRSWLFFFGLVPDEVL